MTTNLLNLKSLGHAKVESFIQYNYKMTIQLLRTGLGVLLKKVKLYNKLYS